MKRADYMVIVTVGVLIVLAGASGAEELSLEAALQRAADKNPAVAAAAAGVEATEYGIKVAGADAYPTLSLSGSYGKFSGDVLYGRFIPGVPGDGVAPVGEYDTNKLANVELKQLLYGGGAVSAAKQVRDVERRAAVETLRGHRLDLEYEVTRAYWAVVLAEHRLEVSGRSLDRSREGLDGVSARHAEQEALEVELLGAQSQLAADELVRLEAENAVDLARRRLDLLLGRSEGGLLELTGSLEQTTPVPSANDAAARAAETGPMVNQATLQIDRADAAVRGARALYRPKLELVGNYSWIDNDLFFKGDYYAAAINLSIPFAKDIRAGKASRKMAEARRRQAEHLRGDATDQIRLAVAATYGRLAEALAAVDVARRNLDFHRENHRVTQVAFREQLATFGDVLERHDELSKAELALYGAHYEARLAEAEIRRLVGE